MKKVLNLPNQITIARFILAVVFIILLSQYSQKSPQYGLLDLAAGLFIVAAATDFLDGYLARKRGEVTAFGRVLDPLVDKVLVCGAFILFAGEPFVDSAGHNVTLVSAWMVVVIVGRELLVTGLRGYSESIGESFGASVYGKIKMWTQSIAAPAILLTVAHEHHWPLGIAPDTLKTILVWATVIITALSMMTYFVKARAMFEKGDAA